MLGPGAFGPCLGRGLDLGHCRSQPDDPPSVRSAWSCSGRCHPLPDRATSPSPHLSPFSAPLHPPGGFGSFGRHVGRHRSGPGGHWHPVRGGQDAAQRPECLCRAQHFSTVVLPPPPPGHPVGALLPTPPAQARRPPPTARRAPPPWTWSLRPACSCPSSRTVTPFHPSLPCFGAKPTRPMTRSDEHKPSQTQRNRAHPHSC